MKLNKLAMVLGFGVALTAGAASAANQGSGTVRFTGAIIDAPCSIKNTNIEVNMGQISSDKLQNGGRSESKLFKIELEGCTDQAKKGLTTTFTGQNNYGLASQGLLGIEGTAKGAAIAITNAAGKIIPMGTASDVMSLNEGNNDLNFAAYLQGVKASDDKGASLVVPGNFTAIANFSLAYL
ncbi:fimbrial protein [Xenorhabdus hominickii]|uniref:Fimbria A protein n=1 Tax=Xenorhabdus hominickii TaxID=351679 RepID=A0A2G0QD45_XENHO|nr:fimbrial protein [Xenorhabdus hominickii]AOM41266.1 fimbria A protein [Xenorhabdus hominickii]PHM55480.1 major mannose-resistant fimbrial protein [Xenorhabdus hominickii]PHM57155.1 major mannose-resistant fimbrial protein [Xenorhabdus hominickii]